MPALLGGLTGGIASGKTTVARLLSCHGAILIDSDELSREVVAVGTQGLQAIVDRFGREMLASDQSLDRKKLGARVFADPGARADLNAIVHPRVRVAAARRVAAAPPDAIVIRMIPLLVETGQQDNFDVVIVVDVPQSMQVERLMARDGLTVVAAERRVNAQATRGERLEAADYVIDNSGTHDQTAHQVAVLWEKLVAQANRSANQ